MLKIEILWSCPSLIIEKNIFCDSECGYYDRMVLRKVEDDDASLLPDREVEDFGDDGAFPKGRVVLVVPDRCVAWQIETRAKEGRCY